MILKIKLATLLYLLETLNETIYIHTFGSYDNDFGLNNNKIAQTGFQFLSVSSDARAGGMADAMTTLTNGSASLFFNPAGLSKQTNIVDINFSSNNWIADIKHDAFTLSIAPNESRYGVFGLSFLNVDYGELQGTVVWDNDKGYLDTEKFSPSAFAIGFGYGRSLSESFSIGIHIKKLINNLEGMLYQIRITHQR